MQAATAHQLAQFMGPTDLATDQLTKGAITNLIEHDITNGFQFQKAIIQYLKQENKLDVLTPAKQQQLIFKRQATPRHIIDTLKYMAQAADKYRSSLARPQLTGAAMPTPEINGRQLALERRKTELVQLSLLVEADVDNRIIPDVVQAITRAIRAGWLRGNMPKIYIQQPKKPDIQSLTRQVATQVGFTVRAPINPGRARARGRGRGRGTFGGRGRGRGRGYYTNVAVGYADPPPQRPRPLGTQASQTQTSASGTPRRLQPQPPNQLFRKDQFATHIPSVPDPDLGQRINWTKLRFRRDYCNNFSVWGRCAVYDRNPISCKFIKRCSNCDRQDHYRRTCPTLPTDEKPEE